MLEVRNLSKNYGNFVAVSDMSFTLEPGDVFAFIGSNGAGKTTTIRMIATLLEPTNGTAILNGIDVTKNPMAIRRMIGYMPDFFGLYDDVKVFEYLEFFATIYGVPAQERKQVVHNVLELTDLTTKYGAFVHSLSRGMQQRLCLARCLVHDPSLLLLDEPASGLDPRARAELKELILELGRMGKMVIVSSHILPELEGFCNKVGIVERGRLVQFGQVESLTRSVGGGKRIAVGVVGDAAPCTLWLSEQTGVIAANVTKEGRIEFGFSGELHDQVALIKALVRQGFPITYFEEHKVDLEDVFFSVTTGAVN